MAQRHACFLPPDLQSDFAQACADEAHGVRLRELRAAPMEIKHKSQPATQLWRCASAVAMVLNRGARVACSTPNTAGPLVPTITSATNLRPS
jgi:hypothetical protein